MKQHGALFTKENRLAIREGRKTQTRRIPASFKEINEHPDEWEFIGFEDELASFRLKGDESIFLVKPPWAVGDELYIKEPFAYDPDYNFPIYKDTKGYYNIKWKSPLFMPKWAARDWLRVTAVHCERLQSISEEDAMAEGVLFMGGIADNWDEAPWCASIKDQEPMTFLRGAYARVWDSINKKYKWAQNPWVVCYTFARLGVTNG